MQPRIDLRHNEGRAWFRSGGTWAKGFVEHHGALFTGSDLARHVDNLKDRLQAELPCLYGEFAVVIERENDSCTAVVDRIRSIPLFFGVSGGKAMVSDDAAAVASAVGTCAPDNVVKLSFLLQGMTLGRETLLPNVHQLRAGESVSLTTNSATPVTYFDCGERRDELAEMSGDELIEKGIAAVEDAFKRLLRSSDGPFVVPLSGGMDSRLVAVMLKRAGRDDTVCYSYGGRDSFDVLTSHRVAQALGLRWEFVPYTRSVWARCALSDEFDAYRRRAAQFCAIEHTQDWPAVRELGSRGALSEMSVFVPGHSGDFLAGSHLPPAAFDAQVSDPVSWVFRKYLTLWPSTSQDRDLVDALKNAVRATLVSTRSALEQFDDYGWRHRQSMMIVNSVRTYEWHGLDWRLPLWDAEMIAFWSSLPPKHRKEKRLYLEVIRKLLGEVSAIPSAPPPTSLYRRLRNRITDAGMHRFGIFTGPAATGCLKPIGTLTRSRDPVIRAALEPWRRFPALIARINGLLSLERLDASLQAVDDGSGQ